MFEFGGAEHGAPRRPRHLVLNAAFVLLATAGSPASGLPGAASYPPQSLPPVSPLAANERALVPTSDVVRVGIAGSFADVDDGTQFVPADNTAVSAVSANFTARHRVGFSGAPSGNVTRLQVYYRAAAHSVSGTIQAVVYDEDQLLATGSNHVLAKKDGCPEDDFSCGGFVDEFTGLDASSANNLRVEMRMT